MSDVTKPILLDETGQDIVDSLNDIASNIAISTPAKVIKPTPVNTVLYGDGESVQTLAFYDFDPSRIAATGIRNIEPGKYVATLMLKSAQDTWADGTTADLTFTYYILLANPTSTTWATAPDSTIDELLTAADAGDIDLADDYGWAVGDERVVLLNDNAQVQEQVVTLVLMDTDHYPLSDGDGRTKFVIGIKGILNATNTDLYTLPPKNIANWCDDYYIPSLPNVIARHIKTIKIDNIVNNTTQSENPIDIKSGILYMNEIVGPDSSPITGQYYGTIDYSTEISDPNITQIEYYKNPGNRIKYNLGNLSGWLTATGHSYSNQYGTWYMLGGIDGNGTPGADKYERWPISPYFCF